MLGGASLVSAAAVLASGRVLHQHINVGRRAITQGASAFSKDLPPFVIAAERNCVFGLNVIGLRRAGLSAKDRDEIKAAFKLVYLSGLNVSEALNKATTKEFRGPAREFLDFVANAKKRGICPFKRSASEEM